VSDAAAVLQQLPEELRAEDSFFENDAPLQLAEQYKQRALEAAESGDYEEALKNIELGLRWSPEDPTLIRWKTRYERLTGVAASGAAARMPGASDPVTVALSVSRPYGWVIDLEQSAPNQIAVFRPLLIRNLQECKTELSLNHASAAAERATAMNDLSPGVETALDVTWRMV
jgi:hypothetical protein